MHKPFYSYTIIIKLNECHDVKSIYQYSNIKKTSYLILKNKIIFDFAFSFILIIFMKIQFELFFCKVMALNISPS